jgi:hypothetical protein
MKLLWLLAGIVVSSALQAQDYLVTTKKDTLRGSITIASYHGVDRAVLNVNGKKTEFQAYGVLLVTLDTISYIPVRIPDAFRLMRLEKRGILNLCYARQAPGTPYNVPYLVKVSGESMEVTALRFKRSVSRFLSECGIITQKIEENELGRNDLEKIVDGYNNCMVQQTSVAFIYSEDPKLSALTAFNEKLSKDTTVPAEAMDILKDLFGKVKEGKPAPNYLIEGLRETLKGHPVYTQDLEELIATLKK